MTGSKSQKSDYSRLSQSQLVAKIKEQDKKIKKLSKKKNYGLVWEDKLENVAKMCNDQLPVLSEIKTKEIYSNSDSPNILIEGDNYHSLSVLNYTHKGKIDIIYIDPPYNTGKEKEWKYNDKYVDKNDQYKHSKWLSFISKRLRLAKKLLKSDGIIFISIDENEFGQLKLLCDDIYKNNLGIFVWQKKYGGGNDSGHIATEHEYILCYSTHDLDSEWLESHSEKYLKRYKEEDEFGKYFWDTLERPGLTSPIKIQVDFEDKTYELLTFRSQKRVNEELKTGEIRAIKIKDKISWQFKQRLKDGKKPRSILRNNKDKEFIIGSNAIAKKELKDVLHDDIFSNPKPTQLIQYLVSLIDKKNSVVLDFFAGSGTTGQAVLQLNKKDNGTRKFILCTNNENDICTNVCYPRLKKVISGYKNTSGEKIAGMKANLKYFKTYFVSKANTDKNKKKLIDKATDILCIKENCFEKVKSTTYYKIFKNNSKYMSILYDDEAVIPFKKEIKKRQISTIVYAFSLDEYDKREEFEDVVEFVDLKSIPSEIINVYGRILR